MFGWLTRIEVAARDWSTSNDGKGNAQSESETGLHNVPIEWDRQCSSTIYSETGDRCNAREHVEENSRCFGHTFS
jgi:hypothetical protein